MIARPAAVRASAPARRARGQALVEFGFVALLCLALVLLVFGGGWLAANWFAVGQAAREGARAGSLADAPDAEILEAVNRTATIFTGGFTAVTAAAPGDCPGTHAVCVCRHHVNATRCADTVTPGDRIDVTVRHRFVLFPAAGGWVGENAGLQLAATASAWIE